MEFEPHVKSPDNAHKAEVDDEVTAVVNKAALSDHISIIVIGDHGEDRLLFFEVDTLRYMDCGSDMDAEDLGDQVEVEQDSDRAIEIMDRLLLAPAQLGKSSCSP
jgi:formylmethanofuran dehydrogenase subunit C